MECQTCGNRKNLRTCSGCKSTFYCSRECQFADWNNHLQICRKEELNIERENYENIIKQLEEELEVERENNRNMQQYIEYLEKMDMDTASE